MMASKAFLRRLRKKYALGEFKKKRRPGPRTPKLTARQKRLTKRYGGTVVYPSGKRKRTPAQRRKTFYTRGKSRTPLLTKYKRKFRKQARKLGHNLGTGLKKLGALQGFND